MFGRTDLQAILGLLSTYESSWLQVDANIFDQVYQHMCLLRIRAMLLLYNVIKHHRLRPDSLPGTD